MIDTRLGLLVFNPVSASAFLFNTGLNEVRLDVCTKISSTSFVLSIDQRIYLLLLNFIERQIIQWC